MERVVFHSTIPSLLARNSSLGSIWGLLKSQLRNSSTPANHYEHFRSRPKIFRRFKNISEDFRTLPKISEDFPKILKNHKNIWKLFFNRFRSFPNISEHFRRFPKIFWKLWKIIKTSEKHFWSVSEVFQKFHKSFKLLKNGLEAFPKFLEICGDFRALPKISVSFSMI